VIALVNSFPVPAAPSSVAHQRSAGWVWLAELEESGVLRYAYPKLGRGMVALFEVDSPETLQRLLTKWSEFVPCTFEVTVLVDAAFQRSLLLESSEP
jgi:hypothetical protein